MFSELTLKSSRIDKNTDVRLDCKAHHKIDLIRRPTSLKSRRPTSSGDWQLSSSEDRPHHHLNTWQQIVIWGKYSLRLHRSLINLTLQYYLLSWLSPELLVSTYLGYLPICLTLHWFLANLITDTQGMTFNWDIYWYQIFHIDLLSMCYQKYGQLSDSCHPARP